MKHKGYYLLFLGLVLTDQFIKQIFMSSFDLGQSIVVNPFLSWTYLQNTGAAFSFLNASSVTRATNSAETPQVIQEVSRTNSRLVLQTEATTV